MSKWIDWISRMQYLYYTLRDDIKSIYAFIPHNASLVDELAETMDCITKIEKDVKNNGWSHDTISRCKQLVTTSLMSGNERQCKVGSFILEYVGVAKSRMSDDKLAGVTPIILMMPLRLNLADKGRRVNFNFKQRLEEGRHRHIKEWTNENLTPNLVVKRINTIGKKCAGF